MLFWLLVAAVTSNQNNMISWFRYKWPVHSKRAFSSVSQWFDLFPIWKTRLWFCSNLIQSNPCSRAPSTWCCARAGFTSNRVQAMWAQSWCQWGLLPWLLEVSLWHRMSFCRLCDSFGPTTQKYLELSKDVEQFPNFLWWNLFLELGRGLEKMFPTEAVAGNRCDLSWGKSILPILKTCKDRQHQPVHFLLNTQYLL